MTPHARALIEAGRAVGLIPHYGSDEWTALPETDPRRVAAFAVAAECWRDHCSAERVADDLHRELAAIDREACRRYREASNDLSASIDWHEMAMQPSWEELVARRDVA